ncbi:MAG: hypothetical protein JO069_17610 [Verrucomicrobia bacterium]|nr:hypothetical protein [Verrucomicrobiota bacterium]
MRSLVAFLLGVIIGGVTVLYLPSTRRDELTREFRLQVNALQNEITNLTNQLKSIKFGDQNASPSPTPAR